MIELAIVLPTYNERDNISPLLERLAQTLDGVAWEAIFVDDDSPDGTSAVIAEHARTNPRVRLIHRIGRRGLASACIEGMMASQAPAIAVMDADMQHDEGILPIMLTKLRLESLDIVVGTRNSDGGSMGEFSTGRQRLSQAGRRISEAVCRCKLSDPMSGFFLLRRSFLQEVVRDLQGGGFKILVDLLASARRPVRIGEVGYTFRARCHGCSKLDVVVGIEYLFLIANKCVRNAIPVEMALFLLVGSVGLLTHVALLLTLTRLFHLGFIPAQICATSVAMLENFWLNNAITFRDRRLKGRRMITGALRFMLTCSYGAWANVIFARALWTAGVDWRLAGFAGIVIGSVWNLSISSVFTWRVQRASGMVPSGPGIASEREPLLGALEVGS